MKEKTYGGSKGVKNPYLITVLEDSKVYVEKKLAKGMRVSDIKPEDVTVQDLPNVK